MSRPRRRGCLWRWLVRVVVAGATLVIAVTAWRWATWPDVGALATTDPEASAFMRRWIESERAAGREPRLSWRWVPSSRISPELKKAVLVAEDIDFFSHRGFATEEMRKALEQALEGRRLRGASTISQQVAKNLWLAPSRSPLRKLEEALLTVHLERELDKRRILEIYLNIVELGPGIYGAEAASRVYFGHPASDLTVEEAAMLAASLSRPSTWHPGVTSKGYRTRVELILRRMDKARWLDRMF